MTGLDVSSLTNHLSTGLDQSMQDVASFANEMDPTDPSDLAQMQMKMMRVTTAVQLESALMKSLEDALKSVTQRI
ncbi:MAG: hypothetical protein OXF05_05130 [Hyphomicrobiales bacterium]|nr:hypothetical protein [Hyphomicrobiales bacterium]MCY4033828.1 hypothetical protein [Hyphomicrobiales bacterium]MCY4038361.1 hypothetical protein [Hyphomicrobiales bacterium]